jgi:hypothetical protein
MKIKIAERTKRLIPNGRMKYAKLLAIQSGGEKGGQD